MELTISKSDLNNLFYVVSNIVEKRNSMPILANVLLSASDGYLTASATDLKVTASVKTRTNVIKPGSTTVNAKVFYEIVKELPDGDVLFKLTEAERIELSLGRSKLRVIGVSADEYPSLPGMSLKVKHKVSSKQLREMIQRTIYSVSLDESRFNLSGVCFEIIENEGTKVLRLVATDGHRLALVTREIGSLAFEGNIIVPKKGLSELLKLLEGEERDILIDVIEGFLLVENERAKIAVRLVDGEFPDYKQVIPQNAGAVCKILKDDFSRALKRVSLMVSDKAKGVRLDFIGQSLRIASSSPELGDASEELAIEYSGNDLSLAFNAGYLIDICDSIIESSSLILELHGELGPGIIYAENDRSSLGIVMPMRLS